MGLLGRNEKKNKGFEEMMNKVETHQKSKSLSVFDLDFRNQSSSKDHGPYNVLFEAYVALGGAKTLVRELNEKKQELKEALMGGININQGNRGL